MATQAAWQQTPAQAQAESAQLWAQYAAVAAGNEHAWIRKAPDAATIATVNDQNRLINWPYPKFMVANPSVNQAAGRSEEHTSELQSLMRISYAVFCLQKKKTKTDKAHTERA